MNETLSIAINGYDNASGTMKQVMASTEQLAKETGMLRGAYGKLNKMMLDVAKVGMLGLVGVVGAVGVASFNLSADIQDSQGQIQAELGVTADEAYHLSGVVEEVWGDNFGENVGDATDVIIASRQQIQGLADEDLPAVARGTIAIRDAFEQDVNATTQAAGVLMEEFGVSSEHAMNMLVNGFQVGLDNSGDFLDTINEYGGIFAEGGASADQFFNILASGQQNGVLGTDKIADSFKELNAIILDGSDARADALDAIGLNSADFLSNLSTGKMSTMEAFDEITGALSGTEDEAVRNQAAVALLGTMVEDMGFDSIAAIDSMSDKWGDNSGAVEDLHAQYQDFWSMADGLWRQLLLEVKPYTDELLALANENMPMLENGISQVSDVIGISIGLLRDSANFYMENKSAIDTLLVVVGSMTAAWYLANTAMAVHASATLWWSGVTKGATLAQTLFNATMMASPIGWVTLLIGGLIAAVVLLWMNWDSVTAWMMGAWQGTIDFFGWSWQWLQANFFSLLMNGFLILTGPIGWLYLTWQNNFMGIQDITGGVIGNVMGFFDRLGTKAFAVKDQVVGAFQGLGHGIKGAIRWALQGVVDNFNVFIRGFNDMSGAIGGPTITPLVVPQFASGVRNFEGGPAIINEAGAEALRVGTTTYLPQGTDVYSAAETRQMQRSEDRKSGGNQPIIIKIDARGSIIDDRSLAEWFRKIKRIAAQQGFKVEGITA